MRGSVGMCLLLACGGTAARTDSSTSTASTSSGTTESTTGADATSLTTSTTNPDGTSSTATSNADSTEGSTGEQEPQTWTPSFVDRSLVCKLISDTSLDDPTANQTHTRFNLRGTDLGIPIVVADRLLVLFGDTVGYRVIWDFGEDPDAVATIDAATALADPSALCDGLAFYATPDIPSVAAGVDPAIERDFAGVAMTAPDGESLADYIAQPAGPFDFMPGTFEVPGGALADGDDAWIFYAGLVEPDPYRATRSYLARWDDPVAAAQPAYRILRPIDDLVGGALGGHFVHIAPVAHDDDVWLFGTGDYRHSGVYVGRIARAALESGVGTELYDPAASMWRDADAQGAAANAAIAPVFETDGVGEISVAWHPDPGLLVALYQRELHDAQGNIIDNRVVLRTAPAPEGPWSEAVTIVDMADPRFALAHCCGATCEGEQILHCGIAGLYGAYQLPTGAPLVGQDGTLDLELPFLVSTWDPYNVVLMRTRIRLSPS